nr:recombination endonuclease subunit [uncultured Mediterranean phage uvMED]|tara:strand:+ start:6475 stop:8193 length:1719 start_codon:yes stop_codon:yes gene_type:complete
MIIFEKLRWRNFLSTGNNFTELDLIDTSSTLVVGPNGAGKSTMLDALCFGLFNRPFRKVSKSQLVNTINERDTLVEIDFSIGSVSYKVVRGMKPNVFEIWRNSELVDQDAANRDYQKYLEQSILKLNFKSFTQVVILGSSTFVPFMQLSAPHRREVIEDLLDIQIFSQMNMLLKERMKDNREQLKECEHQLQLAEQAINSQKKTVDKLSAVNDERISRQQDKFKDNEDRMLVIKEEISLIETRVIGLKSMQEELMRHEGILMKQNKIKSKLQDKGKKSIKDKEFFEKNSTCPTCSQDIEESFRNMKVSIYSKKYEEMRVAVSELDTQIADTMSLCTSIQKETNQLTEDQFEIRRLYNEEKNLMKENSEILSHVQRLNTLPDIKKEREQLVAFQQTYDEKEESCSKVSKETLDYKLVGNLLKDGGIKSKIIAKYIPIINQRINKYLGEMDTFVNFTLDEEFSEVIKSRHRDKFSYASFSEGEKQKIDLSLLFTWRHVAKLKNSVATNLLILDEVFDSSLDNQATDELLKILKSLGSDTNFFVISHKGEVLADKFEKQIRFEKVNGFSKSFLYE